jgi:putative hydrolase of the HAD superfamily
MLRGALLDRDGVLLLPDEDAFYQAAVRMAAHGAGLERALNALARTQREALEAVRLLRVRSLEEEEAFWLAQARSLVQALRLPFGPEDLLAAWPYYRFLKPAPGALGLLRALKGRGLKVGVLSNTLPSLRESLAYHGLDQYVDGFFASCSLGVAKPDPRAFLLALEALGLAPEETLYLDDDPENVQVALELGMKAQVHALS